MSNPDPSTDDRPTIDHPNNDHPNSRRTLLRTLAIGGGAAAVGAVALGQSAQAATELSTLVLLDIPVRVADTRQDVPSGTPAVGGKVDIDLTESLVGQPSGVPDTAASALLNVTVTNTVDRGFFRAYARGEAFPANTPFSNGNWVGDDLSVAASVTTRVDSEVFVTVELGGIGTADVVCDVIGYYEPAKMVVAPA
jgi:hypothetical protein